MAQGDDTKSGSDPLAALAEAQSRMIETVFGPMLSANPLFAAFQAPGRPQGEDGAGAVPPMVPGPDMAADWMRQQGEWWQNWMETIGGMGIEASAQEQTDPAAWFNLAERWMASLPFLDAERQAEMADELQAIWRGALGDDDALPLKDRRFADPAWSAQPAFTLLHQTYLWIGVQVEAAIKASGLPEPEQRRWRFAAQAMHDALSPANFPATNPVVLAKTMESGGKNLTKGMKHLAADLERGQLTHTDPEAFKLGHNLATTPGKVVHETPLYQLIQYSPTTEEVFAVPLVIFPPWINRFYILDLNPNKSFIRWAVEQGVTVFVVSWKSADESMKDVVWDDYIRAQIEAVDHVRERLGVPSVHTIGYCVAGTTLAATLAVLERREEAERVKSATFFTAQIDFAEAGDLLHFVDDAGLAAVEQIGGSGYVDGRVMAATFNMLRGSDLIWNYVVNNYLLGEDYPAFDLLHWNGDVTNLPAKWHSSYLRDLYSDNRLVEPDAMEADGTPIDLTRVTVPSYVQAGREDHIAPAKSVWRITEHFAGPVRFVLAGSGHIAGVVNPPDAKKYQYWTNEGEAETLEAFIDGATEHPGSWWPDWVDWIGAQDKAKVPATGKRDPGSAGDPVIEDAPGRYVMTR